MAKPYERVTVDRANWWNGARIRSTGVGASKLCMSSKDAGCPNQMCCLGFWGQQVKGWSKKRMFNIARPNQIDPSLKETEFRKLMMINDSTRLTHKERESRIKEQGRAMGILFKFVGKYPKG